MNYFEHDTNGALVERTPLFASNLLALYYVLRENMTERRLPVKPEDKD